MVKRSGDGGGGSSLMHSTPTHTCGFCSSWFHSVREGQVEECCSHRRGVEEDVPAS
jgi:hypothetical protein